MQLTPVEPLEERWWCEKSEGRHQQRRETDPAGLVRAARVLLGDVHAGVDRGTHGWCPSRSRGWLSGPSRVGDDHPIAVSRLPAERSEPAPGRWLCLAKDPEQRWQTARDLAAELKWFRQ